MDAHKLLDAYMYALPDQSPAHFSSSGIRFRFEDGGEGGGKGSMDSCQEFMVQEYIIRM